MYKMAAPTFATFSKLQLFILGMYTISLHFITHSRAAAVWDCTLRSNKSSPPHLTRCLVGAAEEHGVLVVCRRSLRQRTLHIPLGIGGTALALHFQLLSQGFCKEISVEMGNLYLEAI